MSVARVCTVDQCDKPVKARGWCQNHYMQARRSGAPPSGVAISCDRCGRSHRPHAGSGHTTCVDCRRNPGVDLSARPCDRCGTTFAPQWAPQPAQRCSECQSVARREAAKRWRDANPEACREYQRRYKAANPDYQREWARQNPEAARALARRSADAARERDRLDPVGARERRRKSWQLYREAVRAGSLPERFRDPLKQRRDSEKRRARKYGVGYEAFDAIEIFERDNWVCWLCRCPIDRELRWPNPGSVSLDHIVPLSKDGPHSRANTAAACLGCNWHKYVSMSEAA